MTLETMQIPVYRPFAAQVARLRRLSPSFLRVTFTGADLDEFGSNGLDQRTRSAPSSSRGRPAGAPTCCSRSPRPATR